VKWVPPTLNAAVTANRYTLFADTVVAGENRATGLRWDPFASTSYRETNVGLASPMAVCTLKLPPHRWTTAGACSTTRAPASPPI
jgi:hypothetical protein